MSDQDIIASGKKASPIWSPAPLSTSPAKDSEATTTTAGLKPDGSFLSLLLESRAKYLAKLGEKRGMEVLGWRIKNQKDREMLQEVRRRMRWYLG